MRNGQVFELQMPTHHIKDSGSSSLPTPKARDHQAEGYEAGLRRASPQVGTIVKALVEGDERILLRSPKASEGQGGALGEAEARKRGNTVGVRDQIMDLVASQGAKVSRASVNLPNLLPTPNTMDTLPVRSGEARERNLLRGGATSRRISSGNLREDIVYLLPKTNLLPTPNTMEHREIKTPEQIAELKAKSPGGYRNLRETVVNEMPMLPTPTTQDGKNNGGPSQFNRNTKPLNTQVLVKTEWGKFEPAVRVWEQEIEREAPSPTKPDGKEGAHRLSSKFTEWMMGLPEGWITDVGLTRNEELKLAGNGVVPQQAELALRLLLDSYEE
jgi:hypothetical protein